MEDITYYSPQYQNFKKLCEDLAEDIKERMGTRSAAMTTVIKTHAGLNESCCDRLKNRGIIPPLADKDESNSACKSISEQTGIRPTKLRLAIRYGITAYLLRQLKEFKLSDKEYKKLFKLPGITKNQWDIWLEGEEVVKDESGKSRKIKVEIPQESLHFIAMHLEISVEQLTNYQSLKLHKRDLFNKFNVRIQKEQRRDVLEENIQKNIKEQIRAVIQENIPESTSESLEIIEQRILKMIGENGEISLDITDNGNCFIVVNNYGNVRVLSGTNEKMKKALEKIDKMGLQDFFDYQDTETYRQEQEQRLNMMDSPPY